MNRKEKQPLTFFQEKSEAVFEITIIFITAHLNSYPTRLV